MIIYEILQLGLMIFIGYIGLKTKYIADYRTAIGKVITRITLPLLVFTSLAGREMDAQLLQGMITTVCCALVVISLLMFLGYVTGRLFKMKYDQLCVHMCVSSLGNVIFLGFPLLRAVLGEEAIIYATTYTLVNDLILWTFGIFLMSKKDDGAQAKKINVKHLLSPVTISFFVGLLALFSGISIPQTMFKPLALVGEATMPLSMIFIGMALASTDLIRALGHVPALVIVVTKMLAAPIIMIYFSRFLPAPPVVIAVIILEIAMPSQTIAAVLASEYERDSEYAAACIFITTLASLVTLPIISNLL